MNLRIPVRRTATIAVALVLAGCFNYVPAELDTIPTGRDVRVVLTREGMDALRYLSEDNGLTSSSGPFVEGTLMQAGQEELYVRVPIAVRQAGFHQSRIGQDVRIARSEVIHVEQRQLDRLGTGLLVAGAAGATMGVIYLILRDARLSGDREGPIDPEFRSPFMLSVPLP